MTAPSDASIEVELTLTFRNVATDAAALCSPGINLKLWSKPDMSHILVYAPSRQLGAPAVARIPKTAYLSLANNWAAASACVASADGSTVVAKLTYMAAPADVEVDQQPRPQA